MPADSFVATPNLRFVERDLGHQRTGRILQQQWVIRGTSLWSDLSYSNSEWRDVPLLKELTKANYQASLDEEITLSEAATKAWNDDRRERAERALKRAGFTYKEGTEEWKPPLGQPPAFLQEQEPKSREETVQEERLARVDASLAKQLQLSIENNAKLAVQKVVLEREINSSMDMLGDVPGDHLPDRIERLIGDHLAARLEIEELKARLPAGMQSCTIVFEECPKGHGSLRATNWVKHGCDTCRIQKQQQALRWVLDNPGAHSENARRVVQEGLEP